MTADPPGEQPDAAIRTSQATFQRVLGGETARVGEKPSVRGNAEVVARLSSWTDRVQGLLPPSD